MISQASGVAVANTYSSNLGESKNVAQNSVTNISKQGDMSRVDKIKESVDTGAYKVDLQSLSEKIAEELL